MSRPVAATVTIELPLPPSVNAAFEARRGSHLLMKTAAYKIWTKALHDEYDDVARRIMFKLAPGPYGLWIDLPDKMRGDIDNRVKLLSDALGGGNLGIVADDAHMDALYVERSGAPPDRVVATVTGMAEWRDYVEMRLL